MESGNSSSMHSSSGGGGGGEEEYDSSRAVDQSISAVFDHHTSLPPPQQNHFNLLHFNHNYNNSLISPNYFNNNNNMFLPANKQPDPTSQPDYRTFSATSSLGPSNIGVIKKTKKRSRASRRAPTTVLTTDTSNFRAMVQEFTGIPAPPLFENNSVVNTTRLNTFLGLSSSSSPNSYNNNSLLLRPFAQKLLSGSRNMMQYQNTNNSFENMNLQALLQAQISNPSTSNDHLHQFGRLGVLQSPSTTCTATTVTVNGNLNTGDNGSYGGSNRENNNDGTWLCSSSD